MSINDDDWYIIDGTTLEILGQWGSKSKAPAPKLGQVLIKGMKLKHILTEERKEHAV